MKRLATILPGALFAILIIVPTVEAQTGKIAGQVTDADSGEPLPGVNVVVEGNQIGATSDSQGNYTILNVPPGSYTLRASFVGYADQVVQGVEVNIDLTTTINFQLQEETEQLQEVTVQATEPVVKPDVSANVANLESADFQNLPVAGVDEVVNLQAGIEPGMSVRGGGQDELKFTVDGMEMRTGRRNSSFTAVSYTSVSEVQVQTGGFAAEYGNVRSGLINVVTKEAPRDRYMADGLFRYQPPGMKRSSGLPEDEDSFFIRPFLPDPDIPDDQDPAFVGTDAEKSAWDVYTIRQFKEFPGWNSIADQLQANDTPVDDLNPDQLVELFRWRTRKSNEVTKPDFTADATIGGPLIPGLSDQLGDLRFLASIRHQQTAYLLPQQREDYDQRTLQLNVTTNFSPSMKLTLHAMQGIERGMNTSNGRGDAAIYDGSLPAYPWSGLPDVATPNGDRGNHVFSPHSTNLVDIDHRMVGGSFTHTLSSSTFYELRLQRMASDYRSRMPRTRAMGGEPFLCDADEPFSIPATDSQIQKMDEAGIDQDRFCFNEAPYGFAGEGGNILGAGYTTGGHWAKTRDTTDVNVWTGKFDLTSQITQVSQVKGGVSLNYSSYDVNWERVNSALGFRDQKNDWNRFPIQGAAYLQDKLEFQGMIANIGVRLDYFDPNTQWWQFDPYSLAFAGRTDALDRAFEKTELDPQFYVSPRAGVSFPVSTNSKVYFNYGHFRQMLDPRNLFAVMSSLSTGIDHFGNPTHPMPQTVAYELGYDQNILDQFLVRVSGYYRDVRKQPRSVNFDNLSGQAQYSTFYPWNYEDVRGVEVTIAKNRGRWIRGFANYTFMARKSGNGGFGEFHENTFEQRAYLRNSNDFLIFAPESQPYARINLEFLSPRGVGPELMGQSPLGNWRLSLLGRWREGNSFTWDGGGGGSFPGLNNNVSWKDFYMFDLRVSKDVQTPLAEIQLFADIQNVFGIRHLYQAGSFIGNRDWFYYMRSLHLPEGTFDQIDSAPYVFVPGDDQPGDFRPVDVEFQPIEAVESLDAVPPETADKKARAYVWSRAQDDYFQWDPASQSWSEVPDGEVEQTLDDHAYIDNPNAGFNAFLNPRRVQFGLRLSF